MNSFIKISFFFFGIALPSLCYAQLQIGLSANLGNTLSIQPAQNLSNPVSISGSVVLYNQKQLSNDWAIQYGGRIGLLGYGFKVKVDEANFSDTYPFHDYGTLYAGVEVLSSRILHFGSKRLLIGLGIGATYFHTTLSPLSYTVAGYDDQNNLVTKFYAEMVAYDKLAPFGKIALQMPISDRFTIGIHYLKHVTTIVDGFYEFQNSTTNTSGTFTLRPGELGLLCLVTIGKQ